MSSSNSLYVCRAAKETTAMNKSGSIKMQYLVLEIHTDIKITIEPRTDWIAALIAFAYSRSLHWNIIIHGWLDHPLDWFIHVWLQFLSINQWISMRNGDGKKAIDVPLECLWGSLLEMAPWAHKGHTMHPDSLWCEWLCWCSSQQSSGREFLAFGPTFSQIMLNEQ